MGGLNAQWSGIFFGRRLISVGSVVNSIAAGVWVHACDIIYAIVIPSRMMHCISRVKIVLERAME